MKNFTRMYSDEHLNSFLRYLNINLNLFYLIFGNLGNLLKVAFFLQKPLRTLPCSIYILSATISDFIKLNNLPVRQLLTSLYPEYYSIQLIVDWSSFRNDSFSLIEHRQYSISTYDLVMCKFRSYLHMFSTDLSSQMLLFASINRFCFSYSRRNRHRSEWYFNQLFSHFPNVHRLCYISSSFCAVISIHHLFNFTVVSPAEGCLPRNNLLWTGWIIAIHCFLLPILMTTFGFLTLRNLGHSTVFHSCLSPRRRIKRDQFTSMCSHCLRCRNSIQRRIDTQLTSMIITEILVTICTSLPYGTYAFYHLIYGIHFQSTHRTEWIAFFIRLSMYFEASCGFYIYLITLTTLRKRFCRTFIEKITSIHCCCCCFSK